MQKDFHYYLIFGLAKLAGFGIDDSETIAYASQYVDDSTESEPIIPFSDQHFDTVRTAHYNLGAFDWDVQKKIYMPFHFLPTTIRRESPEKFSYCTQQAQFGNENQLADLLLKDALNESNHRFRLIRLGVSIHTIADTFSHFGFSGRHHDENNVGTIEHSEKDGSWDRKWFSSYIADMFVPRIGHVEASSYPDYPYLKWRYKNDSGRMVTRDNLKHCLDGASYIFKKLHTAKNPEAQPTDLRRDHPDEYRKINSLLRQGGALDTRIQRWMNYTDAPEYKNTKWRKDALKGDVDWDDMSRSERKIHTRQLKGKAGFDNSRWAYFHRAAIKQRSLVLGWIN